MKTRTRISLLVTYLAFVGFAKPIDAEITKNTPPAPAATRVKNLEAILHQSGLCKQYPNVVKIQKNNTAEIVTYADRQLSDKEIKLLALNLANVVVSNVNKISEVKVRLYDPASTKYWKDIALNSDQIKNGLGSVQGQDQILKSIKIVNNLGLVDGPNLENRIGLYKHIFKLQRAGIPVNTYISKFFEIEKAEKNKENITAQMSELDADLAEADTSITKPISGDGSKDALIDSYEQAWQQAKDNEAVALKAVEEAEQERQSIAIPEAYDMDGQARYENNTEALQAKIDAALATWHQATHDRDTAYADLQKAKEDSL